MVRERACMFAGCHEMVARGREGRRNKKKPKKSTYKEEEEKERNRT